MQAYAEIIEKPHISEKDRLGFTIFLALIFHLIVILGIGFVPEDERSTRPNTLNVVLARNPATDRPDKADFIGQANQLSSGSSDKVVTAATPILAPFPSQQIAATANQSIPQQQSSQASQQMLSSNNSKKKTSLAKPTPSEFKKGQQAPANNLSTRAMAIASLQAELDTARRAESRDNRRRIVSAAIHKASDALYLDSWQRKIEKIGNLNYPATARAQNIYGTLRVKVAIRFDGSIEKITILQSSGKKILDDAARRIVRLAAPFSPLPPQIRKTTDVLEIIRTWSFSPNNQLSTQ